MELKTSGGLTNRVICNFQVENVTAFNIAQLHRNNEARTCQNKYWVTNTNCSLCMIEKTAIKKKIVEVNQSQGSQGYA